MKPVVGYSLLVIGVNHFEEIRLVQQKTETIEVGSNAPSFVLTAANREGNFLLADLLARGPLILEFLRGTW